MGSILILILLAGAAYYLYSTFFQGSSMIQSEIVITYEDGTTKTYLVGPFQTSLSVAVAGSTIPIANVAFITKATPSWTGTPTTLSGVTWVTTGRVMVDGILKQTFSTPTGLPTTVASGTTYTISTINLPGSAIDTWVPFDQLAHTLSADVVVQMSFIPPGEATPKTIEGAKTSSISVKDIGFPVVLSVTLTNSVT